MNYLFSIFLSLAFTGMTSAGVLCNFEPITLPIKTVNLANSGTARGIALSIGTPSTEFAFVPQLDVNNTWMYDVDGGLCPNDTSANYCNVFRGGIFDDTGSSTFSKAPDVATAGGAPGDNSTTAVGPAVGGLDTIQLNSTTSLTHFPIGFLRNDWGNGTYPMNSIGFGLNSTLLSWLKSAGHIGSRTYSIFWGLAGASGTAKMDGSVVLGGYDNAKILGKKYLKSFSSRETCETGMMVEITDIQLNFPKGLNQSIMPSGTINACIVPNFPTVMSLPDKPYYENFENLTGMTRIGRSVGINYGGLLYSPQNVFGGDMTITIASTLSIRIPNNQLILPDLVLDQNGNQQFNSSDVEVMLDALDGDNPSNIPKLGRQFFTSAYLTVNQDAGDFALWQANPTDAVHLLAIKDPTCQTGSSNGSISTNSTHPSTPPGNKDVPVSKTAKSKDTIIAAVACGCATILLALASIFFCGYRRRKQTGAESLYSENNGDLPLQEMEGYSLKRELDAGVDIQELSSSTGQSALNELPGSPVRKKDML